MPHLDAKALEIDPEGCAFLKSILSPRRTRSSFAALRCFDQASSPISGANSRTPTKGCCSKVCRTIWPMLSRDMKRRWPFAGSLLPSRRFPSLRD